MEVDLGTVVIASIVFTIFQVGFLWANATIVVLSMSAMHNIKELTRIQSLILHISGLFSVIFCLIVIIVSPALCIINNNPHYLLLQLTTVLPFLWYLVYVQHINKRGVPK